MRFYTRATLMAAVLIVMMVPCATARMAPADSAGTIQQRGMLLQTAEQERLLTEGREHLLYFRLDDAERAFRQLATQPASEPAARFHLATLALWRALTYEEGRYWSAFTARSDSLITLLNILPEGTAATRAWRTHLRAEAELQRAFAYAKRERLTRAALAGRNAYNLYRQNMREHPSFLDSYKGMGLLNAAVGAVPRRYQWALGALGFSGSVQGGLEELDRAATGSAFNREEAILMYAVVDQGLNGAREGGIARLEALQQEHPDSVLLAYITAQMLLSERRADDAGRLLAQADAARQADPRVAELAFLDYFIAEVAFRHSRFADAVTHFERFLQTFRGDPLVPEAHLKIALSREMMGERDAALYHYRRAVTRRDTDGAAASAREARIRLDMPMGVSERALLLGRNAFDAGRYQDAIRLVQPVLGDQNAPAGLRAEAAYRSGRAYQSMERFEEAVRHYQIAVDRPGDPLAKWGPWSQFHIGESHEAMGDRDAARTAYRRVLAYEDPFEYHNSLEQRARTALARR